MENQSKKMYRKPEVEDWGTVVDLTANGNTHSGGDCKEGSNANMNCQ